jgi:hypothetical protein
MSKSLFRSLSETRAYNLRQFEREVLMRIHVNKKEYKANTSKQERVLKGILIRKAGSKEDMCKQERVLREILYL